MCHRFIVIMILTLCPFLRMKGENFLPVDSASVPVKVEWELDFRSVFDNREGDRAYTADRTFFFTQLSPEIGLSMDNGIHRVMGGVVWTQPIGCEFEGHRVSPTLYYLYQSPRNWRFAMGMLPRTLLARELPDYIVSDSTRYFQRNLRSAIIVTENKNGYFQGVLDWRGMQSRTRREAFCVIAQGEWNPSDRVFLSGGLLMLNHLAKQKDAPEDQHVVDNLIFNPYIGVDLSRYVTPFSAMILRAGALMSLTRDRGDADWLKAAGLWSRIDVSWWRLTLTNTLYASSRPLFPLYSRYGSLLNDGEPFYASDFYDRVSLKGSLIKWRDNVNVDASLDFNFTNSGMIFYQRVLLSVNF